MATDIAALQPLISAIENAIEQQQASSSIQAERIIQGFIAEFRTLLQEATWLDARYKQPHPDYYQQYLLYVDPRERFSIVSFVWNKGQKTPIHNHEVWGAIGVLEGAELSTDYEKTATGLQPATQIKRLNVGDIDWFSPEHGDIHAVENAFDDRVSISIHIYGADIGKVERFTYQLDGTSKPFISGYSTPNQSLL